MSGRRWTNAARLFTASVVGFLLADGLCGYGGGLDTHVSQFQIKATGAGAILAVVSFVVFLLACNEVGKKKRKRWP